MAEQIVQYPIAGPNMNRAVPYTEVPPGFFGYVSGADLRYTGGIRKYYGNKKVLDLADVTGLTDIETYDGVDWAKAVTFQKTATSLVYRGWVIRWDAADDNASEKVTLVYTLDGGSTWAALDIWASGVGSTLEIDCITVRNLLMVTVDTVGSKTIYYDTTTEALTVTDMGPGTDFDAAADLGALGTPSETGQGSPPSYFLAGSGQYQFAYRFYSSSRGVYSALSSTYTYVMGADSSFYKLQLTIPQNTNATGFDKIDLYRSINLGDAPSQGAILYLETTVTNSTVAGNQTVEFGSVHDEALPFYTQYDPEKDIVKAPPAGGAIGRYGGITFMAQASNDNGGYNTYHSSLIHRSPEYFSTYNEREGDPEEGRPLRYLRAGNAAFILTANSVTHIFKASDTSDIQYNTIHYNRGLAAKGAAHTVGNSVMMISGVGVVILNGNDGNMGLISAADRVLFDDWSADYSDVTCGYDELMNASYFLHPATKQVLVVGHNTHTVGVLEGMNFSNVTYCPDVATGANTRAYFMTAKGLIVTPDAHRESTGTARGITTGTLGGTVTSKTATSLTDSNATFNSQMVGALLYMTTGEYAGECREITSLTGTDTLNFTTFGDLMKAGDGYVISPVPFKVRFWPLKYNAPGASRFKRWKLTAVSVKSSSIDGLTDNANTQWRAGYYRNGSASVADDVMIDVSDNPSASVGAISGDGIDLEPYLELLTTGVDLELTGLEASTTITESRKVTT
jgi:hypothetical protein